MIDTAKEQLIPLRLVPTLPTLPKRRGGANLHPKTVRKWARVGLRGVKLESVCFGGTPCTSAAALQRFFERLQMPDTEGMPPTVSEQHKAQERARAILARYKI